MARVTNEVLHAKLEALDGKVDDHIQEEKAFHQDVRIALHGTDQSPGIKGRLQRLEDRAGRHDWYIGGVVVAIISAAVTWLGNKLLW